MAQPTAPTAHSPIFAVTSKGANATIWSAGDEPGAALDGDFQSGTIIDTGDASALACTVKYDAAAAANALDFFFLVSNAPTMPAIGDDEWAVLPHADVSPTRALQTDDMPADVDITIAPEWGLILTRPGFFRTEPADGATDKVRLGLVVSVRHWRYIVLLAKEHGNPTTDGTLVVDAALIVG